VEPGSRGASHPHLKEDEKPGRRVLSQLYQKEEGNVEVGGACCMDLDVVPASRGASQTDLQEEGNAARRGTCRTEWEKDVEPESRVPVTRI